MRIRSLVTGAVLGTLTLSGLSVPQLASAAARLETVGPADQGTTTTFNVYLPLTHVAALEQLLREQTDSSSPNYHQWLTPDQFKRRFGPSSADFATARSMLQAAGFSVLAEHTQNLTVQGPVWAVEQLFATQLNTVKDSKGRMFLAAANHGRLNLPQALSAMGAVIPEFAPHLAAHVHSQLATNTTRGLLGTSEGAPLARLANVHSLFYADDMIEAYQQPSFVSEVRPRRSHHLAQLAGVGSTIGIVISSLINPNDLAASFNSTVSLGGVSDVQDYSAASNLPVPTVTFHPVNGGSPPFNPHSSDGAEASLDTQMSLGTAPGAKEIVYDMPALDNADIAAAYTLVDEENLADVVSSSFGECELDFIPVNNGGVDFTGILKTFHALFQQGNAQGITFLTGSGDNGAPACESTPLQNNQLLQGTDFVLGVENPADDPNVTAVGGTNLQTAGTPTPNDVTYVSENANFDPRLPQVIGFESDGTPVTVGNNTWGSGGGFSQIFDKPFYQFLVRTGSDVHRSVPDVSLMMGGCPNDADIAKLDCTAVPRSAIIVFIGGRPAALIGTSSSSPQMAGVLALAVEANGGRLGNVNPLIYGLSALQTLFGGEYAPPFFQFYHRNISGDNNGFTVKPGQAYSEVLGNGTLDIKNFLGLPFIAPAGAPGTPSNP